MSVSPGSSRSLRQDSGAQRAAEQIRVLQSESAPQLKVIAHWLQAGPPQSTSDSDPLRSPSVHEAASHAPARQRRLLQSSSKLQWLPLEQRLGAQGSPQSTSDSRPFRTPSAQLGAAQVPARQTPEAQSTGSKHD
jgi:hypothetical protein